MGISKLGSQWVPKHKRYWVFVVALVSILLASLAPMLRVSAAGEVDNVAWKNMSAIRATINNNPYTLIDTNPLDDRYEFAAIPNREAEAECYVSEVIGNGLPNQNPYDEAGSDNEGFEFFRGTYDSIYDSCSRQEGVGDIVILGDVGNPENRNVAFFNESGEIKHVSIEGMIFAPALDKPSVLLYDIAHDTDCQDLITNFDDGGQGTFLAPATTSDLDDAWQFYYDRLGVDPPVTGVACGRVDSSVFESIVRKEFLEFGPLSQALRIRVGSVGHYSGPNVGVGVSEQSTTQEAATPANGGGQVNGEIPCDAEGLGWILCPLINLTREGVLVVAGLIDSFLRLNPLPIGNVGALPPDQQVVFRVWQGILSIANVALVIAFLVIIYSQATSLGLTNYGIKKMLPRLLLVAIGMNLSYYICAFLVDVSNLAGAGIASLIFGTFDRIGGSLAGSEGFATRANEIMGNGFTVSGETAGLIIVALLFLAPVLLTFIAVMLVIAARTAIVIMLVILSPLAFAAWLLPNTEKWFKKWSELFVQMLMLYPMIMAVFAGATVASQVVASNPGNKQLQTLLALIIQVVPLIFLPAIVKLASSTMGRIDNLTRNGLQKTKGAYDNTAFGKYRKAKGEMTARSLSAGNYAGKNPVKMARSRLNRGLNRSGAFGVVTGGYGASRSLSDTLDRAKEREDVMREFGNDTMLAKAWAETGGTATTQDLARRGLNVSQIASYQRLHNARRHRGAESFIAAQQMLANMGEGDATTLKYALDRIREFNPGSYQSEAGSLIESSRAAWRSAGRGDLVGRDTINGIPGHEAVGNGFKVAWQEANVTGAGLRHALTDETKDSFREAYYNDPAFRQRVDTALSHGQIEGRAVSILSKWNIEGARAAAGGGSPPPTPSAGGGGPAPGSPPTPPAGAGPPGGS